MNLVVLKKKVGNFPLGALNFWLMPNNLGIVTARGEAFL